MLSNLPLVIVALCVLWIGPAALAGSIAARKGRPYWLYVVAGLLLGPIVLIGAVLLPRKRSLL